MAFANFDLGGDNAWMVAQCWPNAGPILVCESSYHCEILPQMDQHWPDVGLNAVPTLDQPRT